MSNVSACYSVRRGVTLVELLVVVGIMVLLATIAIPAFRPLTEGRGTREAVRAINVFFNSAQNRAAQTGRPVGVMFERGIKVEGGRREENACVVLRQAEVPLPYSGDVFGAVVAPFTADLNIRLFVRDGDFSSGLIRRGDIIQLNNQGPWYAITSDSSGTTPDFPVVNGYIDFAPSSGYSVDADGFIDDYWLTVALNPLGGLNYPWSSSVTTAVPFQVLRQPVPSATASLQLPRGTVVDLSASGTDRMLPQRFYSSASQSPVVVMFAPSGSVDCVYFYNWVTGAYGPNSVTGPIHFLVGKWERMSMPTAPDMRPPTISDGWIPSVEGWPNWLDANNRWLALNPQTGLVTVAENGYMDPPPQETSSSDPNYFLWEDPVTWGPRILYARRFARQGQITMGGR